MDTEPRPISGRQAMTKTSIGGLKWRMISCQRSLEYRVIPGKSLFRTWLVQGGKQKSEVEK
jgi:hypothetical protein